MKKFKKPSRGPAVPTCGRRAWLGDEHRRRRCDRVVGEAPVERVVVVGLGAAAVRGGGGPGGGHLAVEVAGGLGAGPAADLDVALEVGPVGVGQPEEEKGETSLVRVVGRTQLYCRHVTTWLLYKECISSNLYRV